MQCESALLAREDGFGSVTRCGHRLVHVQLGVTTLTLTGLKHNRGFFGLRDTTPPTQRPRWDRGARSTLPRALLGGTGSGPGWHWL